LKSKVEELEYYKKEQTLKIDKLNNFLNEKTVEYDKIVRENDLNKRALRDL